MPKIMGIQLNTLKFNWARPWPCRTPRRSTTAATSTPNIEKAPDLEKHPKHRKKRRILKLRDNTSPRLDVFCYSLHINCIAKWFR